MDQIQAELVEKVFLASVASTKGVNAKKFRADNHEHLDALDDLENRRYIENINDNYYIKLIPLLELSENVNEAEKILYLCELLFKELHAFYLVQPGHNINLNDLANRADIPRSDVNKALSYMVQSHIFGGYTTNLFAVEDATVSPGERILRFNSFREVIEDIKKMQQPSFAPASLGSNFLLENPFEEHKYISQDRINSIELLTSNEFDFSRLTKICKEINDCASHANYLALGALIRMLLDHVPPIFGFTSFKEVAANYKSGKSLKNSLKNLEDSSRNISDGVLHQIIRRRESLPTLNQVNFSPDIDVLIGELIRKVEESNDQ